MKKITKCEMFHTFRESNVVTFRVIFLHMASILTISGDICSHLATFSHIETFLHFRVAQSCVVSVNLFYMYTVSYYDICVVMQANCHLL